MEPSNFGQSVTEGFLRWFVLATLIALIDGVALCLTGVVLKSLGLGQPPPCEGFWCLPGLGGPAFDMIVEGVLLAVVGGGLYLVSTRLAPGPQKTLPVGSVIVATLTILTFAVIVAAELRASAANAEVVKKKQEEKKAPRVVKGSNASDPHLTGGPGDDTLMGYEGNDNLVGLDGNDTIYGGPGDDQIGGYSGKDVLYGESGNDTIQSSPVPDGQVDFIDCGEGEDTVSVAEDIDELVDCESVEYFTYSYDDMLKN